MPTAKKWWFLLGAQINTVIGIDTTIQTLLQIPLNVRIMEMIAAQNTPGFGPGSLV